RRLFYEEDGLCRQADQQAHLREATAWGVAGTEKAQPHRPGNEASEAQAPPASHERRGQSSPTEPDNCCDHAAESHTRRQLAIFRDTLQSGVPATARRSPVAS